VELLDQIDRAVDGLCPCGAPPRDGSAYCSEDCVPTYRAAHTSSDTDGTQMRWRPDLVTAVIDRDLTLLAQHRRGRFNAQVFQRGDTIHLRLDDGHRFVGVDVEPAGEQEPADYWDRPNWGALEQELGNGRHVEAAASPLANSIESISYSIGDWLRTALGLTADADWQQRALRMVQSGLIDVRLRGTVFPTRRAAFNDLTDGLLETLAPRDLLEVGMLACGSCFSARLLPLRRFCGDCESHCIPTKGVRGADRPSCGECGARLNATLQLSVGFDLLRERYDFTVTSGALRATESVNAEDVARPYARDAVQRAYDTAEAHVLADLGLAERPTGPHRDRRSDINIRFHATSMNWLALMGPVVSDPRSVLRISNV